MVCYLTGPALSPNRLQNYNTGLKPQNFLPKNFRKVIHKLTVLDNFLKECVL